jgi:hypothetical protein
MREANVRHHNREAFRTLTRKSDPIPERVSEARARNGKILTTAETAEEAAHRKNRNMHCLTLRDEVLANRVVVVAP